MDVLKPYPSAGSLEKRTQGGDDLKSRPKKGKQQGSPKSKYIIGGIAFLLVTACMIAVIVMFGVSTPDYEVSQVLFSGQLQFEELNNAFIPDAAGITGADSPGGQRLISNVKPKMIQAFDDEGIAVEDVVFTTLFPTPPFTTRRNELTSARSADVPGLMKGRAFDKTKFQYAEKQYTDVRHVNGRYEVIAKPSTNAAVVGSAGQRHWPLMADYVESSLASQGVKSSINSMDPSTPFLKAVQNQIKTAPSTVIARKPRKKVPVDCDCQAIAITYPVGSIVCKCPESCHEVESLNVLGGHNDIFSSFTHICKTAYYLSIIPRQGGHVTIINIGEVDEVEAGPEKKKIVPDAVVWRDSAVKFKVARTIITPTTPTPPSPVSVAPEAQVRTSAPSFATPATQVRTSAPSLATPATQSPGGDPSDLQPTQPPRLTQVPFQTPIPLEPVSTVATVGPFVSRPTERSDTSLITSRVDPLLPTTTPVPRGQPTSRGSSGGFPDNNPGGGLSPDLTTPPSDRRTTTAPPPPGLYPYPTTSYDIPEKCLFTVIVRYRNFNYWFATWTSWFRDHAHPKYIEFAGLIAQRWGDSAAEIGFKIDEILIPEILDTRWSVSGIGLRICFMGDLATNARIVLSEETERRGSIPDRLLAGAANYRLTSSDENPVDFAELYGFRYSTVLINEMNRIEGQG